MSIFLAFIIIFVQRILFSFDYAGFSVWCVDFKYNEELTSSCPRTKLVDSSTVSWPRANIYLALSVCWVPQVTRSSLVFLSSDCRARGERLNVDPDWESYAYTKLDVKDTRQNPCRGVEYLTNRHSRQCFPGLT